jgi:hypothetical protein
MSKSGRYVEEKNTLPLTGIELGLLCRTARRVVATPTVLTQLLTCQISSQIHTRAEQRRVPCTMREVIPRNRKLKCSFPKGKAAGA